MNRQPTNSELSPRNNAILIILLILTGFAMLFPALDYQLFLSQGDHGRDLYAFDALRQGQLPYKDFWWVYGPLMLYYYSLIIGVLGISIKVVLAAKFLLVLISGLFVFLILSLFISPMLSLIGAIWFFIYQPDFFFTYNHVGGILAILAVFYYICLYIKHKNTSHLYIGLLYAFLLCLIKINFGVIALFMIFISRIIIDNSYQTKHYESKKFYLLNCLIAPFCVLLIYISFCINLTPEEIRQCFPYLSSDQPFHLTLSESFKQLMAFKYQQYFSTTFLRCLTIIFFICLASLPYLLRKPVNKSIRQQSFLFIVLAIIYYVLNLNEYLLGGVVYRSFWSSPFEILFLFFIIGTASKRMGQLTQIIIHSSLMIFLFLQIFRAEININNAKKPEAFLNSSRAKIYVGNSPEWIETVRQTTEYIFNNLGFQEKFFALPYDPLYYYLTDRLSPTRQLIFFDHIHIAPNQEKNIIQDLEKEDINWIILSNQISSTEVGLGTFGQSYCPLLYQYINQNFKEAAQFGDWSKEPGWAWNHGTKILKRIGYEPALKEQ